MKRILSLVLAMVMVLGSFGAVFAEDTTLAEEAVEVLMDLGVLTEGKLEQDFKRQDAIVLLSRLFGVEETAKDFPAEDLTFEDVVDPFYEGYIAWAVAQELTDGKSETKFGFDDKLKTQELAMFLLRALGYGDVDFDDALEEAQELGLLLNVADDAIVKRGDMALMTLNALATPMKDSETTLAEHLELVLPEEPAPAALEVEEVVADNLKSFRVVFNQEVESAKVTAKTTAGIKLTASLSEDKTELVGYYDVALSQSASVTFTVNAETEEGQKVEDLEIKKVVTDTVVPAVLEAKALNPKQIEVLFSEPVQLVEPNAKLLSSVKVDGVAIVAESSVDFTNNKAVLTLLAPMAEGTRVLEIGGIKDFANFVVPVATFDLTVVKDETAPVAVSAEVKNNTTVVVTFNEPLSKAALGTYTVDGVAPAAVAFVDDTNYTQVRLTLTHALSIGAVVEVKVGYKGQRDIMGNEVKETTYITTKVLDDTALPTVEVTSVGKNNKITLTFSKSMTQTGKYQILDKDDKVLVEETTIPAFKGNTNATVLEITDSYLASVNPAVYKIKLIDMKDGSIRTNPLGTTTLTFTSVDTKVPTADATYKFVVATTKNSDDEFENKITIYFSEAMDKDSVENLANYMIGTNPLHVLSDYTEAVASADNKSVTITYVTGTQIPDHNLTIVILPAVKDVAGNNLALTPVDRQDLSDLTLSITDAELTALNKVKVTFDKAIATVYPSLFSINDENNYFVNAAIDGTSVIFTTARDLKSDMDYTLTVVDKGLISNKFGENLSDATGSTRLAVDKVAPTVKVAKNTATTVKFTFSKDVTKVNVDNEIKVRKADGSFATAVVLDVYKADGKTLSDNAYGRVFIVSIDVTDVTKVKVGFPLIATDQIVDIKGNSLLPTDWLEVK